MSKPLTPDEIAAACTRLPDWTLEGDALVRSLEFGSFREAMSFLVRASYEAEELNHHPEWTNVYRRVHIRLTTHDAGDKVTAKDVELALRLERITWVS